jgi:steroid Delta-isomerase
MVETAMQNPNRDGVGRIYERWHEAARARDVEGTLALYAEDAILESPLVMAILDNRTTGVLKGKAEIRSFFEEGTKRRPNDLVRWYRTGIFLSNGTQLVWEYPRATPDGDQVDLVEIMDVAAGVITQHRIYWGWFGVNLLTRSAAAKATRR